jgi:hypothetical protein
MRLTKNDMARLTYRKGPLGVAVLRDGKPWGSIKNRGAWGWQVNVPGLNAATAVADGKLFQGKTVFPTLAKAKAAVEEMAR